MKVSPFCGIMIYHNENTCKLPFIVSSTSYLIIASFIKLAESCIPVSSLEKLVNYGKLVDNTDRFDVPKRYFKFFYISAALFYIPVALYEIMLVYALNQEPSGWCVIFLNFCCGSKRVAMASQTHTIIAVLLLTLQIWRRFYETHFVCVFSKKATMSIFQFISGMFFYMGTLMIILSEAQDFDSLRTNYHFKVAHITTTDIVAILVFLWAWYHQHKTTVILANLRKNKKGNVVSESYKIPEGDLFKYLSSPHCTTEIIMYSCLWVILGMNHSWWCVYTLVLFNQLNSIISTHQWYHKNFKDFPRKRKALIPFLI